MALAKRDEGKRVTSDINVTPMVDVMLVLLIIFMVITPMLQHGHAVELAKANNPEQMPDADKEDAILIAITRDNKVYLNNDQMAPDQLADKVRDRLANKADKRVYVKADARAKYGTVVAVVDNVRSAGVDQLGLLTEQRRPLENKNGQPPPAAPVGE
jgi:biopolymer transport protein TolR